MTTKISGARRWFPLAILLALIFKGTAFAQTPDEGPAPADLKVMVDTLWVLMTAFLVFWMNAGFGCVESGLCRAKNATNILAKIFGVFALSPIAYWIVGFGIMFADGNSFMGMTGWLIGGADNSPALGAAYQGVFGSPRWEGGAPRGGGWLAAMGMRDFAGSSVVHAVGGWSGLAGILVLGPRLGKYKSDGTVKPIPGHSMAL